MLILFLSLIVNSANARLSNVNGDDEECLGLVLLTATLCLIVPMINNAGRSKRYYPLYQY